MSNLTTMFVAVAGLGAVLMGGVGLVLNTQDRKLKSRLSALDSGDAVIFTQSGPKPAGFDDKSCQTAWRAASKIASSMTGTLFYKSDTECAARHHEFNTRREVLSATMHAMVDTVTHYPPMIGYQALADDPAQAVPLYPGPTPGTAVRCDGRQFNI